MKKKDTKRQTQINKIGARFEDQIADMITSIKPPTEEVVIAAMAALASSLAQITIVRFGKEKAPDIISVAINNALERATREEKEKEDKKQ